MVTTRLGGALGSSYDGGQGKAVRDIPGVALGCIAVWHPIQPPWRALCTAGLCRGSPHTPLSLSSLAVPWLGNTLSCSEWKSRLKFLLLEKETWGKAVHACQCCLHDKALWCISDLLTPTLCLSCRLQMTSVWCVSYAGLETKQIQLFSHNLHWDANWVRFLRWEGTGWAIPASEWGEKSCVHSQTLVPSLWRQVQKMCCLEVLKLFWGKIKARKRTVGVIPNQEGGELPNPSRCFLSSFHGSRVVVGLEQQ